MTTIEIELSNAASAVLTEMAERGKVTPEAIARFCVENTLSQAIDRSNAVDGDEWFLESARDVNKACRKSWEEVNNPGDYANALKSGKVAATKGLSEQTTMRGITSGVLRAIQSELRSLFGTKVDTSDYSAATLFIAPNSMCLTNKNSHVIAEDAETVVARLSGRSPSANIKVTLDERASKLVRWYAAENSRDIGDVANGVLAGELGHLKEGVTDDSPSFITEYVLEAICRRSG